MMDLIMSIPNLKNMDVSERFQLGIKPFILSKHDYKKCEEVHSLIFTMIEYFRIKINL